MDTTFCSLYIARKLEIKHPRFLSYTNPDRAFCYFTASNPFIGDFYVVQKHRLTSWEAVNSYCVWSGRGYQTARAAILGSLYHHWRQSKGHLPLGEEEEHKACWGGEVRKTFCAYMETAKANKLKLYVRNSWFIEVDNNWGCALFTAINMGKTLTKSVSSNCVEKNMRQRFWLQIKMKTAYPTGPFPILEP